MKTGSAKHIETVSQLVKALGGTKALAKWANVSPSAVSNWKFEKHIPPGWHLRLYLECKDRKLSVAPALFGIGLNGKRRPDLLNAASKIPELT